MRLAAWATIARSETLPIFLIEGRENLAATLEQGDTLAEYGYPVALRVGPQVWSHFRASDQWDRVATRWRQAPTLGGEKFPPEEIPSPETARLVQQVAPTAGPTLDRAARAVAAEKAHQAETLSPEARSAVEALLYTVLEARPLTKGRFKLNAALGFRFGPREAEGDLVCAGARLVVEIDGYYHFRDSDAYRRDRRKDAALQEHRWFVLRFLAEDIVCDLDNVLAGIEARLARLDLSPSASA
jgi:very-short-patch-repair endonuclease